MVFFSTWLIYLINAKSRFQLQLQHSKLILNRLNRADRLSLLALSSVIVFLAAKQEINVMLYLSHLLILSVLYDVPTQSYRSNLFPLRSIPFIKILIIAYVWASISSGLPTLAMDGSINSTQVVMQFAMNFLFILSITLPFDIRDMHTDNIVTIPQHMGIRKTKILAICCLLFFSILFYSITESWLILPFSSIIFLLIINTFSTKKSYYFSFFLDGTIILYFFMVMWIVFKH